jgi:GT2 family glycosyltransferase
MAVRRKAFEQIRGFDEEFDFLDADTDFSMRLQDASWLIITDSSLQCFHQGSGSPQTTACRVLRYHRNRWLLLQKDRRVRFGPVCKLILFTRHMIELLFKQACAPFQKERDGRLADFVQGRIKLLRTVWRNYT